MATRTPEPTHPVSAAVLATRTRLEELAEARLWSMTPEETAATLADLARLAATLAELELRVAAHADATGVGTTTGPTVGATSTAAWWAHTTGQDRGDAARRIRLAHTLDDRHAKVRAALAAGDITEPAAQIVVRALDALPGDLDPLTARRAETVMVQHATDLPPRQLRLAGKALLAVIAPDLADAHEGRLLDAEERRARAATRLSLWDDGHGTTHGRFTLPTLQAAMLKKMLTALAAPKHQRAHATQQAAQQVQDAEPETPDAPDSPNSPDAPDGPDSPDSPAQATGPAEDADTGEELPPWRRPGPERMGHALAELIERFAGGKLPDAGGMPATIVVTMTLDALHGGLGAARLDTGDTITAAEARRLACQAGLIPLVLGGNSVPLDVGRKKRFHDHYQRIAITHRDKTCTTRGCDTPAWLCHVHHDELWSEGGTTSVTGGRLLCPRHHHTIHDPTIDTIRHPDGQIEFRRRT